MRVQHTSTRRESTTSTEAAAATATRSSAKCHCFCCVESGRCAKGELVRELREKFELKMKLESQGQSVPRFADGSCRRITPPNAPAKAKWAVVGVDLSEIVYESDVALHPDLTLQTGLETFYLRHGSSHPHHAQSHHLVQCLTHHCCIHTTSAPRA